MELQPKINTKLDFNFTQNDILDMMEGETEAKLVDEFKSLNTLAKATKSTLKRVMEDMDAELQDIAKNQVPEWLENAATATKTELGITHYLLPDTCKSKEFRCFSKSIISHKKRLHLVDPDALTYSDRRWLHSRVVKFNVTIRANNSPALHCTYEVKELKPTKAWFTLSKKRESLEEVVTAHDIRIGEIHYQMALLEGASKRYKAKMLKQLLNNTDEGKQILKIAQASKS